MSIKDISEHGNFVYGKFMTEFYGEKKGSSADAV
jgi:hypothetical protein